MPILHDDIYSFSRQLKNDLYYCVYHHLSNLLEFGDNLKRYRKFYQFATVHPSVKLLPNAIVDNFSENSHLVRIGENSVIRGQLLVFAHAGEIEIGKDCYVGEGSRIWSASSIKIGNRVLIAHNVNIHDTNSHSLNSELRHHHFVKIMSSGHPVANDSDIESKSLLIEDDVWIGFNSTILKGVRIGRGAIVAACSVVSKNVPEFVVVAGNPAEVIRKL